MKLSEIAIKPEPMKSYLEPGSEICYSKYGHMYNYSPKSLETFRDDFTLDQKTHCNWGLEEYVDDDLELLARAVDPFYVMAQHYKNR